MKKITKLFLAVTFLLVGANNLEAQCYIPTQQGTNIFQNPSFDGDFAASGFAQGWTNFDPKSTENSCADGSDTSGSLYLKGSCYPNGGVLEYDSGVAIIPGHDYQIKAMIKNETALDDAFNFHLDSATWDLPITSNGASAHLLGVPNAAGWMQFDVTITSGAAASGNVQFLFMSCDSFVSSTIDDLIYLDNLEIFDLGLSPEPTFSTLTTSLSFSDVSNTTATFTVTGANLTNDITLTPPAGITLDKTTITVAEAEAGAVIITATFDASANIINQDLTIASTGLDSIIINVIGSLDAACFTPLHDSNMIPDATVANRGSFGGWGGVTIVNDADGACGATSALLTTDGVNTGYPDGAAFDASDIDWVPSTQYRLRARVKTVNGAIGFLLKNIDSVIDGEASNLIDIDTFGIWELIDITFTTGPGATSGFVSFNSADASATAATETYIDNYELYDLTGLSTNNVSKNTVSVRAYPNPAKNVLNIETNFEVSKVSVYDALGRTVLSKIKVGKSNLKSIDVSKLSSGTYILHATIKNKIQVIKFIK